MNFTLLWTCHRPDQLPLNLQMPNSDGASNPVVMCTRHMCPIQVHWHVKLSYKNYWRVKVTITNLNYAKNFSEWNLVVQHPNLQSIEQVFSFNYKPLHQYGSISKSSSYPFNVEALMTHVFSMKYRLLDPPSCTFGPGFKMSASTKWSLFYYCGQRDQNLQHQMC